MITNFLHVIISIEADTPEDAYAILCDKLASPDAGNVEWTTDTFTTQSSDGGPESPERYTVELWPDLDDDPIDGPFARPR